MKSICASRNGRDDSVATALFPIPFPYEDAFGVGPSSHGQKKRLAVASRKLMHLTIMALNYERFRNPMSILPLIRRHPSRLHKAVFHRIWMFYKACGPPAQVSISGCGRKSFQLDARFRELEEALDKLGLSHGSIYHHGAAGNDVPEDSDAAEQLRPYRPLDASRIKLHGTGSWRCEPFLSDLLYMPFVEPDCNRFEVVPPWGSFPDVRDCNPDEVFRCGMRSHSYAYFLWAMDRLKISCTSTPWKFQEQHN